MRDDDLIEGLGSVAELLDDRWDAARNRGRTLVAADEVLLAGDRPPLYVAGCGEPTGPRRPRYAVSVAVAALALVAVATTALVTSVGRGPAVEVPTAGDVSAPEARTPGWLATWPSETPDALSGVLDDGRRWSVQVDAGTWEICYRLGDHTGCELGWTYPTLISDGMGGPELAFGVVMPGITDREGQRVSGPATAVELELGDGTPLDVEFVSHRIWATIVPPGTEFRQTIRQSWDDGSSSWGSSHLGDADTIRARP